MSSPWGNPCAQRGNCAGKSEAEFGRCERLQEFTEEREHALTNWLVSAFPALAEAQEQRQEHEMSKVEEAVPSQLWVNGRSDPVSMVWASSTHAELILGSNQDLRVGQMSALVVRGFLSLPMRVELQNGQHLLLRFAQRLHSTVLEVLQQDLLETGVATAHQAAGEIARGADFCFDFQVWGEEDSAAA